MNKKISDLVDRYYIKKPHFRRFVTKLIYGDKDIQRSLFGTKLLFNSLLENGYLRASLFTDKSSFFRDESAVIVTLSNLIGDDTAFVDCGANIGVYSSIMSKFKRIYRNFDVYAFEAMPDTFSRLQNNSETHDFHSFNYALSAKSGIKKFYTGAVSHVATTAENICDYHILKNGSQDIECKPLAEFDFGDRNLILKIDVEGQELEVLEGAKKYFDENKVKAVYIDGYKSADVLTFLGKYDFIFFNARDLSTSDGNIFSLLALRIG